MQNDEIDDMLSSAVPPPASARRRGLDAESSRALTEVSANRGHIGHVEGHRSESFLQERDRTKPDDPRCARDPFSDDVAAEILSKTHGTRESGDDFLTAATRAVERAVRTGAAEFRDPAKSARAIIDGVLRGAGENEDTALKTLSLAARAIVREALLLGYGPTDWIEGILSGAIAGAGDLGLDRENAISAVTQGILKGAVDARLEPAGGTAKTLERTMHATLASLAGSPRRSEAP
jgi:hypothetical protein